MSVCIQNNEESLSAFVRNVLNNLISDSTIERIGINNLPTNRDEILSIIESYASDTSDTAIFGADFSSYLTKELLDSYHDVITLKRRYL